MKYVSIDLETTGLNPDKCQVIEFAAILDDTEGSEPIENLPVFQAYVVHEEYRGEPYALALNASIIQILADFPYKVQQPSQHGTSWIGLFCTGDELCREFKDWLRRNAVGNKITAAGKNFASFDNQFLARLPGFGKEVRFHHRVIDPAMFYWRKEDAEIPNTAECMKRAGIEGEVQHRALDDARDVVKLIRSHFNK